MPFYADLHIHSKHSRATSSKCDLEHLAIWARRKGVSVVATGDLTFPTWRAELKEKLVEAEPGLFRLRDDIQREVDQQCTGPGQDQPVRFMLEAEISTIYKRGERTRKVHHLLYAPGFEAADRIADRLDAIGNIKSDGRPILGLDSRNLLEITLGAGKGAFLIPAHIWTPWFSVLGSKSGFDDIDECYGELAPQVFALETGLSSDPPMNWQVSSLDRFRLVSNSDLHSPTKIGREACVFSTDIEYFSMLEALKTGKGYNGTIEFYPEEGKYHLGGHRKCDTRMTPKETSELNGLCPVCGKPVTVGVSNRVHELSDRPEGEKPATASPFRSFIPLTEIISEIRGVGPASKTVIAIYDELLARVGPELHILGHAPIDELKRKGSDVLARAIDRMRQGQVIREGGYDGEYGVIRVFSEDEREAMPGTGRDFKLT